MNVRELMKKVDGELVAVHKDGSWVPKAKVIAWSDKLREEIGLPYRARLPVKRIRDKDGVLWSMYIKPESKTWIEKEQEVEQKVMVEEVDPRLTDPTALAMNHLKRKRRKRC